MNDIKNKQGLNEEEYLSSYDITAFEQPSVTVDMLLFTISNEAVDNYRKLPEKSLKVLLIKRNEHPFIGHWAIPGGFVGMKESLEAAAYRELKEETGVENTYLEQLYTYGDIKRDPRGRIISTAYMALVNPDEITTQAGSDADDARWFTVDYKLDNKNKEMTDSGYIEHQTINVTLTNETTVLNSTILVDRIVTGKNVSYSRSIVSNDLLSFDHGLILQYGVERLRNKLEYSDIVFHLMPDLFTLTDLQQAYEEILDKKLLKANFRRKTAKLVTETEYSTSDAGHRPSKLFKYNPDWMEA